MANVPTLFEERTGECLTRHLFIRISRAPWDRPPREAIPSASRAPGETSRAKPPEAGLRMARHPLRLGVSLASPVSNDSSCSRECQGEWGRNAPALNLPETPLRDVVTTV